MSGNETKESVLNRVQDYNDNVGIQFQKGIEHHTADYKQGIIHHSDYIEQIKLCVTQAKELLIKI